MKRFGLVAWLCLLVLGGCAGRPPENIGVHQGRLAPCPDTPNCVSSMETREGHAVQPFAIAGGGSRALDCLETLIRGQERAEVLQRKDGYLHAAFASKVFGFVDDVEFLLADNQQGAQVLHVRSAARLGYSDFGVNRKRVERLRREFRAQCGE